MLHKHNVFVKCETCSLSGSATKSVQDLELDLITTVKYNLVAGRYSCRSTSSDMLDSVCARLQRAPTSVQPLQRTCVFQDLSECMCFLCQVSPLCLDRPGQSGSPLSTLRPNTHIYQSIGQQQTGSS